MWKDFFYYSRSQRQGIIVLLVLIIGVIAFRMLFPLWLEKRELEKDEAFEEEYSNFIASLQEKTQEKKKKPLYPSYSKMERKLVAFNPNTADSITFIQLGLPSWMVGNILKYRSKNGLFRKAEDFKKIYGLTEEQYKTLHPYIRIPSQQPEIKAPVEAVTLPEIKHENPVSEKREIVKYTPGTLINLNLADTTELKKIPGIGSVTAKKIVQRRRQLGGFYHINQLNEIKVDANQFESWFSVDENDIEKININKASLEKLRAHPYINFYQAKAIIEYRKKKGKIKNLLPFTMLEEFTEEDLERMKYYVCFE